MPNPISQARDDLAAALTHVAKFAEWERGKYEHKAPPLYVWKPTGGDIGGAKQIGTNPRALGLLSFQVEVACWGADDEAAFRLFQALWTAIEQRAQGRNYRMAGLRLEQPEWTTAGRVWVADVRIDTHVPEATIPATSGVSVGDKTDQTVAPTSANQATPALSTPGDGWLEGTES